MNLFYPSHDIALANGVKHFNPPAAALRLQEDLASLSDVWNSPFLRGEEDIPLPWGWDYDTRQHIHQQFGIKMHQLPTDEQLHLIRQLSSRRSSITLLQALTDRIGDLGCVFPQWLDTEDRVFDFIRQQDERHRPFVFKTPWSSSGRGLSASFLKDRHGVAHPAPRELLLSHACGTIRKMGGVMGEDWIEGKVHDFAMLFHAGHERVTFLGYSLFDNDDELGGTTYRQGHLLSNDEMVRRLAFTPSRLSQLAAAYETILSEILFPFFGHPWQLGYLGIDMLTYHPSGSSSPLAIHPCIELNLRCTMGVVCRLWFDKHLQEGTFRISPMLRDGHFKAEFLTSQ